MKELDPIKYNPDLDLKKIEVPKDIPVEIKKPMSEEEAEVTLADMAGVGDTVQEIDIPSLINKDGTFNRPRSRNPSYEECETLGGLVAMGLTLEMACTLLTPPLKYEKVEKCLTGSYKKKMVFRRAQAKWLHSSLKVLLTRPSKEIAGLIFILKNRHSKLFDAGRLRLDVTSAGNPLQLTSPEVINRARLYAKSVVTVDAEIIEAPSTPQLVENTGAPALFATGSTSTTPPDFDLQKVSVKEQKDKERAKAYLQSLLDNSEPEDDNEQEIEPQ